MNADDKNPSLFQQQMEVESILNERLIEFGDNLNRVSNIVVSTLPAFSVMSGVAWPLQDLGKKLSSYWHARLQQRQGPVATMLRERARIRDLSDIALTDTCSDHRSNTETRLQALYPALYDASEAFDCQSQDDRENLFRPYFPLNPDSGSNRWFHCFDVPILNDVVTLPSGSSIRRTTTANYDYTRYCIQLVFTNRGGSRTECTFTTPVRFSSASYYIELEREATVFDVVENTTYPAQPSHFSRSLVEQELKTLLTKAGWCAPDFRRGMTTEEWTAAVKALFEETPCNETPNDRYASSWTEYFEEDGKSVIWEFRFNPFNNGTLPSTTYFSLTGRYSQGNISFQLNGISPKYQLFTDEYITDEARYWLFEQIKKRRQNYIEARLRSAQPK